MDAGAQRSCSNTDAGQWWHRPVEGEMGDYCTWWMSVEVARRHRSIFVVFIGKTRIISTAP